MKKTIILSLLAFTVALTSCFEDKGNYDYKEMGEIKVEGINEKGYSRISMKERLEIPTTITSTMDGNEFEYIWGIHPVTSQGEKKLDTISFEQNLSYDVINSPGLYKLVYRVVNKKNGLFKYITTDFTVTSDFSDGWYVLKDSENKTEMDLHSLNNNSVGENLIKKITGRSLEGEAQSLGYFLEFKWNVYQTPPAKPIVNNNKRVFIPCSKKEAMMFNANVMEPIFDWDNMFYGGPNGTPLFTLDNKRGTTTNGFVTTSGVFAMNTMNPAGSGKFGMPVLLDEEPMIPSKFYSKGNGMTLLFDEAKSRFVIMTYSQKFTLLDDKKPDGTNGDMSPNNMNSDLLAMRPIDTRSSYSGNAYALMRKRDATKDCYLLKLTLTTREAATNPIVSVTNLDKSLNVCNAKIYGANYEVPFIYFANNNVLSYYDCEMNVEHVNIKTFPTNENIVFIKHLIYKAVGADVENTFNYLVIGTQIGDKYKVYLYTMLAGRPNGEPARVLEGTGRAVDMHFISSKMEVYNGYTI